MNYLITLTIAFILLISSCSRDKLTLVNDNVSPETKEIISRANRLELSIQEGLLLRNATPGDKARIIVHIQRMKVAIINLEANPNDKSALVTLTSSLQMMQTNEIQILEADRDRLDSFFDEARFIAARYTNLQLDNNTVSENELTVFSNEEDGGLLTWSLFWDSFSDKGIEDVMIGAQEQTIAYLENFNIFYNSYSNQAKPLVSRWDIRTNTINPVDGDSVFIASGRDVNGSWMLTTCDFTNVRDPSFMFNHSLLVNRNAKVNYFQPNEFLRETFYLFASTTYDGGQPAIPTEKNSIWDNLNLFDTEGIPSGQDFHTVDSSRISLKQYEGKKVTLGFYFDFDESKHGRHYLSWQLNYFEVFGSSTGQVTCTDPDNVFEAKVSEDDKNTIFIHSFASELGEFQQINLSGDPIEFTINSFQSVEVTGFKTKATGTQLLYSPVIDLAGNDKPAVQMSQTGKFYSPAAQDRNLIKRLIAIDEPGKSISELDWKELNFETLPTWESWTVVTSEWLAIQPEFLGKKIRLGFQYSSDAEAEEFPTWQISNVWVKNITE